MGEAAWLSASRIPPENRRPIPAELCAVEAAARYAGWLKDVADFDVVLLGMRYASGRPARRCRSPPCTARRKPSPGSMLQRGRRTTKHAAGTIGRVTIDTHCVL
jgi:hypothetical protein